MTPDPDVRRRDTFKLVRIEDVIEFSTRVGKAIHAYENALLGVQRARYKSREEAPHNHRKQREK
jgi:hypothetical protein